jgi:hypothetical protein
LVRDANNVLISLLLFFFLKNELMWILKLIDRNPAPVVFTANGQTAHGTRLSEVLSLFMYIAVIFYVWYPALTKPYVGPLTGPKTFFFVFSFSS